MQDVWVRRKPGTKKKIPRGTVSPSWQTGMKTSSATSNAPTLLGTLHVCNGNAASTGNSSDNTIRHNQSRPRSARSSARAPSFARMRGGFPRTRASARAHRAIVRMRERFFPTPPGGASPSFGLRKFSPQCAFRLRSGARMFLDTKCVTRLRGVNRGRQRDDAAAAASQLPSLTSRGLDVTNRR